MIEKPFIIDALQYCKWSKEIFHDMNRSGVAAVHVTISYHENFPETIKNINVWNRYFDEFSEHVVPGRTAADIRQAHKEGRTAIIFGFQNCSAIEGDIGLIEICHQLGVRFMQLSYNNQSLLATGCYEDNDSGITRMCREAIREMNRIGMVIDMSHSSKKSTLEAIDISERPIAISHANPSFWHPARRNKADEVLKALAENGGMLGFSLYPHHLNNGSNCSIEDFCSMVAQTAELMGVDRIGFGSDLCQDQPDTVVTWRRNGTSISDRHSDAGSETVSGFPTQPHWFRSNLGFSNVLLGLRDVGFSDVEVTKIAGGNWLKFFDTSFPSKSNT